MENQVLNSNGSMTVNNVIGFDDKPIVLDDKVVRQNRVLQEQVNALGYKVDITTLTAVSARVIQQKFYTVDLAKYVPIRVGNASNAWADSILRYRQFSVGGDFSTGLINQAEGYARLADTDTRLDSFLNKVNTWAKQCTWSLPELMNAQFFNNWDIVEAKEKARLSNFQLGLQSLFFIGDAGIAARGILNMVGVNSNTSVITKAIRTMSESEFNTFVGAIVNAYRANSNYTAWPNLFIIPESDFTGMVNATSATFPIINKLEYLRRAFADATMNPNFQILPSVYGTQAFNAGATGMNLNRYSLTNNNEDSASIDMPVPYTTTAQNSINGFQFQNVGYARFSGAVAGRPLETLYFDY